VLIAHGRAGDIIISSDGKPSVTVSELVNRLDALEDMKGRPKVLIIESCRGGSRNTGFEVLCCSLMSLITLLDQG